MSESSNVNDRVSIGRIPLKQVRVNRAEREAAKANPMNKLVPYLDLFDRLDDDEMARLAGVEAEVSAGLRSQVDAINEGLAAYVDLLPRLTDAELVRLTGASDRTIRFWRLCQPRGAATPAGATYPGARADAGVPDENRRVPTAPHSVVTEHRGEAESIDPAGSAQEVIGEDASGYITLSGAPFPGFEREEERASAPQAGGVSLEDGEGEPDPLGLKDP